MKFFLASLFISISAIACGQQSGSINFSEPSGNPNTFRTKNKDYSNIKTSGSPFFDSDFKAGKIFVRDKLDFSGKLRYNAYLNEIEVLDESGASYTVLKRFYIHAVIDDKFYKILPFKTGIKNLLKTSYFNPLNRGRIVLMFRPNIKLKRGRIPSTSYGKVEPPKYIDVSSYFIKKGDAECVEIKLRKKDILRFLDKERIASILEYAKVNDLSFKKERDVISLLEYHDGL